MENLQQEMVASQTEHQQVADQLKEALNDKSMLETQMEASLSLLGPSGTALSLVPHTVSCQGSIVACTVLRHFMVFPADNARFSKSVSCNIAVHWLHINQRTVDT